MIMRPRTAIAHGISALVLVTGCNFYVDVRLADFVKQLHLNSAVLAENSTHIPDILFPLVCVITAAASAWYRFRAKRGFFSRSTLLSQLLAYAVPISYAVKVCLKYVCGRITTKAWLVHPELYGFNWFQGSGMFEGFPSGHMLVFTTLTAACCRFYPRHRYTGMIFLLLLAAVLLLTNYHFLGDVIAGFYLGLFVEAGTYHLLQHHQRGLCSP